MEERTSTAINRNTNVNIADTNYGIVMARGIIKGEELTPLVSPLTSGVIHLTPGINSRSGINIGNANGLSDHIGVAFFGVNGVARKIKRMYLGVPSIGHDIPSGYTELDSITSTGTQWIDTGANPTEPKIELVVSGLNVSNNTAYFAGIYPATTGRFALGILYDASRQNILRYSFVNSGATTTQTQTSMVGKHTVSMSTDKVIVDGESVQTLTGTYSKGTDNIAIFGAMRGSNPYEATRLTAMTLHSCRIWDGSVLLRDYIPAMRDSDHTAGLYDLVTNGFYSNNGTGEFSAGSAVGGSMARVFFEAIQEIVPITVTNSDSVTSAQARYINYHGTQYASAASFEANAGDEITISVRGYNSTYSGKITVNGTRVFTQNANSFGNYTYTVPTDRYVTIDLVQRTTTSGKTTYYYGEITITEV